jgi:hypothetical protein
MNDIHMTRVTLRGKIVKSSYLHCTIKELCLSSNSNT